jgi:hypothetical protein
MKEERQIRLVRMSIYLLIWILLLLFPFISNSQSGEIDWKRVFGDWIRFSPFLIIFFVHHFALLPLLITRKKKGWYILITIFWIGFISALTPNLRFLNDLIQNVGPPLFDPFRPPMEPLGARPLQPNPGGPRQGLPGPVQPLVFYNFLVSIMLVGFDAAILIASDWFKQEKRTQAIQRDQIQAELAFLRNQVSPHFFMNTLNNIHALIEVDQDMARDAVIRLSKLMRYLLYETGTKVPLKKEFEFLSSYFDLMRIRYSEQVEIVFKLPDQIPEVQVPPLLTISLIENAFKHGISYESNSYINAEYSLSGNNLEFRISNSDFRVATDGSGIGLTNVRKQLDVLFSQEYDLQFRDE